MEAISPLSAMDAALERIPSADKVDYIEAKSTRPEMVQRESNPELFLACEDGNADKAARRLVAYWKYRRELFGTRALKQILLTGTGALTDSDAEIFAAGAMVPLPKDVLGRLVIFFDRDHLSDEQIHDELGRARCFFYLLTVLCMDRAVQKEGVVFLASVANTRNVPVNDAVFGRYAVAFNDIMPMKTASMHLLAWTAGSSAFKLFVDGFLGIAMKLTSRYVGLRVEVHRGPTKEYFVERLSADKLPLRCIPEPFGGTWSHERFRQWHRKQLKVETKTFLTDDERRTRRRKANVVHSRQKRFRRKVEEEVLSDRVEAIKSVNKDLTKRNSCLEILLSTAVAIVESHPREQLSQAASRTCDQSLLHDARNLERHAIGPTIGAFVSQGAHELQTAAESGNSLIGAHALGPAAGQALLSEAQDLYRARDAVSRQFITNPTTMVIEQTLGLPPSSVDSIRYLQALNLPSALHTAPPLPVMDRMRACHATPSTTYDPATLEHLLYAAQLRAQPSQPQGLTDLQLLMLLGRTDTPEGSSVQENPFTRGLSGPQQATDLRGNDDDHARLYPFL